MKKLYTIVILLATQACNAQQPSVFQDAAGAIRGYDAVAYFTEGKPVKGLKDFTYRWHDADWYFSSAENLSLFKQAPESYAPQYGGYCAFGTSRGYKAETQPEAFTVFNNKLYLNYDTGVVKTWQEKKEVFILRADENWKHIENK